MKNGISYEFYGFLSLREFEALAADADFDAISVCYSDSAMYLPENTCEICIKERDIIPEGVRFAVENNIRTVVLPAEIDRNILLSAAGECRGSNTVIALENGYGGEDADPFADRLFPVCGSLGEELCRIVDSLNRELLERRFFACINTGHSVLCGEEAEDAAKILSDRVISVHASDNHRRNDYHLTPFKGRDGVHWECFMKALRGIGYDGAVYMSVYSGMERELTLARVNSFKYLSAICGELINGDFYE